MRLLAKMGPFLVMLVSYNGINVIMAIGFIILAPERLSKTQDVFSRPVSKFGQTFEDHSEDSRFER